MGRSIPIKVYTPEKVTWAGSYLAGGWSTGVWTKVIFAAVGFMSFVLTNAVFFWWLSCGRGLSCVGSASLHVFNSIAYFYRWIKC